MQVRTRFAPSPTGYMHVGGIRTALFAWLVAKQNNGKFILRIEDTDKKREVKGAEEHILRSLEALGIDYDEGPKPNSEASKGSHGPYRQSQRLWFYKDLAQYLYAQGRAYADPYTPEEVQAFRDIAQKDKKPFLYRDHRPENPPEWGLDYVDRKDNLPLRFKSDPKPYKWHDEVMGDLSSGPEVIDDFILMKSDGYPTYNFAHIVDDLYMEITHIIRGQEFLASVPNYLNLYEALEITPPIMATVPHILGPDGKKKLSKRDGAKDVLEYLNKEGYPQAAMINFIASMGWNDGTEQEVFTVDELINKFSLDRVQKSGARFDEKRLEWLSGQHIRLMTLEELYEDSRTFWGEVGEGYEWRQKQVLSILQDRLKKYSEIPELSWYFFNDSPEIDPELIKNNKQLKKFTKSELKQLLQTARNELSESNFYRDDLTDRLNGLLNSTNQKPAVLFSLIRIAVTQAPASPGLVDTMALIGKDDCLKRIDRQIAVL